MALTIPEAYQTKYTRKLGALLQQKTSRFEPYCTIERGLTGDTKFFDTYGLLKFKEKTSRMGNTSLSEPDLFRRALRPRFFDLPVGHDENDNILLGDLDNLVSKDLEAMTNAASRTVDEVIIEGFLGDAYTGPLGVDPVPFDSNQIIATNYVETGSAAASNLTVGKLRRALTMFMKAEAWGQDSENYGDQLVLAVSSEQINALLRTVETTSKDYSDIQALVDGRVDKFLGFKILRSELLPVNKDGIRECVAWVKSRAQLGFWANYKTKISVRDDMDEAIQVRAKFGCNATRLEEKGFVKILCDETK